MSCLQTILDGRWHSSNCWQHLLQSSPAKLVLNDPIYSPLVFEKSSKLLVSNWRVTFGSVHRTSCNTFLLPAARLLATVFLSCSMLHVAMAHLGSLIQHLWWIYDINWHHTYHTTSNVPFFGPHIESGDAKWCHKWCQLRCQASAGGDLDEFPCDESPSCAGPLAIASSFQPKWPEASVKHSVKHSVPYQTSTPKCFWLIRRNGRPDDLQRKHGSVPV